MRKIYFFLALIVLLFASGLLISGASLLVLDLGNAFPLGTLITWCGIGALPCTIYFGAPKLFNPQSSRFRYYRNLLLIILALSISWAFVAFLLAGNWRYNFGYSDSFQGSYDAATWFWKYTYFVVALPLLFLVVYLLDLMIFRPDK